MEGGIKITKIINKKVINRTRNSVLASKYKLLKSIFDKAVGLMFHKNIKDEAYVFENKKESLTSLHMFFVFFRIDVLFIDKNKRVVELKENFKPFTLYVPEKKSKYIIELPSGTIKNSKTSTGDKVVE